MSLTGKAVYGKGGWTVKSVQPPEKNEVKIKDGKINITKTPKRKPSFTSYSSYPSYSSPSYGGERPYGDSHPSYQHQRRTLYQEFGPYGP